MSVFQPTRRLAPCPASRWRRLARPVALGVLACLAVQPSLAASPAEPAPLELKFGQFFSQPVGPRGLELTSTLRQADGHQVRLVGYMVAQEQPAPGRFLLTPRPVRLSEHADGEADDLPPATVTVLLDASQATQAVPHQAGLISVTGRLQVGRAEDDAGRVSWVRLQLAPVRSPQAVAPTPAASATPFARTAPAVASSSQ